jgi:phage replication-related protein YjqB (UPF0714/DUF867 family)
MKKHIAKILVLTLMFTLAVGTGAFAFTAGYHSFDDLAAAEDPADYSINVYDVSADTTLLAIHGGGIESGTSELVEALNGKGKYNAYLFEGLKGADNGSLFIRAINFDEPQAVGLVQDSAYTVSIIGAAGDGETTYIGGQNRLLAELIRLHLVTKGYDVETLSIPDRIAGIMDSNIVNQNELFGGYELGGVQIAVSKGLRDKLAADPAVLNDYSGAVNTALSKSWPAIANQLKKIAKGNCNSGFLGKYSLFKPSLDKEVDRILEKDARTPEELIKNADL